MSMNLFGVTVSSSYQRLVQVNYIDRQLYDGAGNVLTGITGLGGGGASVSGIGSVLAISNSTTYSLITTATVQAGNFVGNGSGLTGAAYLDTYYLSDLSDSLAAAPNINNLSGFTAGYLKTLTISDILDLIVFPTQLPTYTIPTVALSVSSGLAAGSSYEVGRTSSQIFIVSYDENDAGPCDFLNLRRGTTTLGTASTGGFTITTITPIASQFGFIDPNNPNNRYSANFTDFITISTSAISFTGRSRYQAGLAKQNNKNATDTRSAALRSVNAPQLADSTGFDSSALSYSGLYPYFWGVSASAPSVLSVTSSISSNSGINKVVSSSTGTITIPYSATVNYLWFATPATSTTKSTWFENALNTGPIGGPSNLFGSASTANVNSPDGFWNGISYKIYITNYATLGSTLEMRN
jgi:hypothetical protein